MIQPKVLLDMGDERCGRYLGKTLVLPLQDGLCTTPPALIAYADLNRPDCAAMCLAHFDELIHAHPEWVASVGPLNSWGESPVSKQASEDLARMKHAAGKAFG